MRIPLVLYNLVSERLRARSRNALGSARSGLSLLGFALSESSGFHILEDGVSFAVRRIGRFPPGEIEADKHRGGTHVIAALRPGYGIQTACQTEISLTTQKAEKTKQERWQHNSLTQVSLLVV